MITDMIDLEPLLDQYDSDTVLVGPLLSLSMNSSYRYCYLAGKGPQIYISLGLGFVESESDAKKQRADLMERLRGRFTEVVTFDSHPEMAQAVHARWLSEETARVLSSAKIETKTEAPNVADDDLTDGDQTAAQPDEPSQWLINVLARELLDDARRGESPLIDPPAPTATRAPSASEQSRNFGPNPGEVAGTANPAPAEVIAGETINGSGDEAGLTISNDQFSSRLPREFFNGTSHDHEGGEAVPVAALDPANLLARLRASGQPASNRVVINAPGHDNANGRGTSERPAKLPPAPTLPPLTDRPTESALRQQRRDFGLTEDDIASAVLKLRFPTEPELHRHPPGRAPAQSHGSPRRLARRVLS